MDYTEYTAVKNRFSTTPSLCDLFKLLSIETWKRIEYAYLKPRVKVFETTITQNLIFSINAYNDQYGLNIDILEALDEKTNGNDFELIIRYPSDGLEYYAPIQAKKVYRDGRYASMDHGVQIESLIDYANANDAKPFYLLYNFAASPLRTGFTLTTPLELTGCTLVSAEHLFNNHYNRRVKKDGTAAWLIPNFYNLNPDHAFPWHELVCPDKASGLIQILQNKGLANKADYQEIGELARLNKDYKQGFYPLNTFGKSEKWVSVNDLTVPKRDFDVDIREARERAVYDIMFDEQNTDLQKRKGSSTENEKVYPEFSPKSRIILSKK